jgi:hypothetical protein
MLPSEILAIPLHRPDKLFSSPEKAKNEYRRLAKTWHPDAGGNTEVFAHIAALWAAAAHNIELGVWDNHNTIRFDSRAGTTIIEIVYEKVHPYELGSYYVANKSVIYFVHEEFDDLVDRSNRVIKMLKFADPKMEKEFKKHLPTDITVKSVVGGKLVRFGIGESNAEFSLRDIYEHFNHKVPSVHVAWIMSRLYNICCYLQWAKLTHNGISMDACMVDPANHYIKLTGGWWYSVGVGSKLKALPESTMNVIPSVLIDEGLGSTRIDLECVKALGRELLGDRGGSKLLMDKTIPKYLLTWLRSPAGDDAFKEFDRWTKVLLDAFGKRHFTELKISAADLYKE